MAAIKQEKRNQRVASVNALYILKTGCCLPRARSHHLNPTLKQQTPPPTDNTNYYYHYYNYIERWRKNDRAFDGHRVPDDKILIDCEKRLWLLMLLHMQHLLPHRHYVRGQFWRLCPLKVVILEFRCLEVSLIYCLIMSDGYVLKVHCVHFLFLVTSPWTAGLAEGQCALFLFHSTNNSKSSQCCRVYEYKCEHLAL